MIIFYEYFLDRGREDYKYKRIFKAVAVLSLCLLIFITVIWTSPSVLQFRYAYLKVASVLFLLPFLAFVFYHPKILIKFLKVGAYFFFVALIVEIMGLKLNHWSFPSADYVAVIKIADLNFPVKELFFYFMIGAMAILSYYEFLDDDGK